MNQRQDEDEVMDRHAYWDELQKIMRPRSLLDWCLLLLSLWVMISGSAVFLLGIRPQRTLPFFLVLYLPACIICLSLFLTCLRRLFNPQALKHGMWMLWGATSGSTNRARLLLILPVALSGATLITLLWSFFQL